MMVLPLTTGKLTGSGGNYYFSLSLNLNDLAITEFLIWTQFLMKQWTTDLKQPRKDKHLTKF
jgi:hypothetical protein